MISEIATGLQEDSTFVPRKDQANYPTKKIADVDDLHYRIEPLDLQEKKALEYLEYFCSKCDKNM